jgi:hypothetical protein
MLGLARDHAVEDLGDDRVFCLLCSGRGSGASASGRSGAWSRRSSPRPRPIGASQRSTVRASSSRVEPARELFTRAIERGEI